MTLISSIEEINGDDGDSIWTKQRVAAIGFVVGFKTTAAATNKQEQLPRPFIDRYLFLYLQVFLFCFFFCQPSVWDRHPLRLQELIHHHCWRSNITAGVAGHSLLPNLLQLPTNLSLLNLIFS
jgi:hypothetical protein